MSPTYPPAHGLPAAAASYLLSLVDRDAQLPQLRLGQLDLPHDLLVRLGDVVERQDAPAQPDEEVCAEGDQRPYGQDGDDFGLDDGGERNQLEVECEVDLERLQS